jgi:hypothetical protein
LETGVSISQESPHTVFTYTILLTIFGTIFGFIGYAWYVTREGAVLSHMQVAGAMAFVGLLLIIQGIYETIYNFKINRWPTCEGVITCSEVDERSRYDEDLGHSVAYFYPKVRYHYEVNSVIQEGYRIAIQEKSSTEVESILPVLDKYPVGKSVRLSYNPYFALF